MGIPTEDAMRQVQLINDANNSDRLNGDRANSGEWTQSGEKDRSRAAVAPGS
jgi:hypothetical protein